VVVRNVDALARIHYTWEPPFEIAPGKTSLLVVDLQRHTADPRGTLGRGGTELTEYFAAVAGAVRNAQRLIAAARTSSIDVVHIRLARRLMDGRDVRRGVPAEAMPPHRDSDDALFLDAVRPRDDEIVIDKTTPSAFTSTGLDFLLRTMGVRNLLVCGVPTNVDVLMTVRDADDHAYRVITVADACAAATRQLHETVLPSMNMRRMRVKTTDEVVAMLERCAGGSASAPAPGRAPP
jgi:nicotinamidase-related amidase